MADVQFSQNIFQQYSSTTGDLIVEQPPSREVNPILLDETRRDPFQDPATNSRIIAKGQLPSGVNLGPIYDGDNVHRRQAPLRQCDGDVLIMDDIQPAFAPLIFERGPFQPPPKDFRLKTNYIRDLRNITHADGTPNVNPNSNMVHGDEHERDEIVDRVKSLKAKDDDFASRGLPADSPERALILKEVADLQNRYRRDFPVDRQALIQSEMVLQLSDIRKLLAGEMPQRLAIGGPEGKDNGGGGDSAEKKLAEELSIEFKDPKDLDELPRDILLKAIRQIGDVSTGAILGLTDGFFKQKFNNRAYHGAENETARQLARVAIKSVYNLAVKDVGDEKREDIFEGLRADVSDILFDMGLGDFDEGNIREVGIDTPSTRVSIPELRDIDVVKGLKKKQISNLNTLFKVYGIIPSVMERAVLANIKPKTFAFTDYSPKIRMLDDGTVQVTLSGGNKDIMKLSMLDAEELIEMKKAGVPIKIITSGKSTVKTLVEGGPGIAEKVWKEFANFDAIEPSEKKKTDLSPKTDQPEVKADEPEVKTDEPELSKQSKIIMDILIGAKDKNLTKFTYSDINSIINSIGIWLENLSEKSGAISKREGEILLDEFLKIIPKPEAPEIDPSGPQPVMFNKEQSSQRWWLSVQWVLYLFSKYGSGNIPSEFDIRRIINSRQNVKTYNKMEKMFTEMMKRDGR